MKQPLILLPTLVNGRGPFEFILDAGANVCVITPEVAAATGIRPVEERRGVGAAGEVVMQSAIADNIAVSETTVANVAVGISDELRKIGAAIGARVDGALGYTFLRKTRTTIDYPANTITVSPTSDPSESARTLVRLPLQLADPRKPLIVLDAYFDDRGPFTVVLDTGASMTAISLDVAKELDLPLKDIPQITGGGGTVQAAAGRLRTLRIDTEVAEDVDVVATPALETISRAIARPLHGILGHNFLKRYRLILDYLAGQISLART